MNQTKTTYSKDEILELMPQQPPFMFIDSAEISGDEIRGVYNIKANEPILEGHFKNNPIFPGTIMLEVLGQLGVLYLITSHKSDDGKAVDPTQIFFTSADNTRCMCMCRPKDTLTIYAKVTRMRHPIATFEATLFCNDKRAAFAEKIALTFDYKK